MTVGIAVRDDVGITHWAPFSDKGGDAGRNIARQLQRADRPRLFLMCGPTRHVNQVRRVSTRVASVTCMTCIVRM